MDLYGGSSEGGWFRGGGGSVWEGVLFRGRENRALALLEWTFIF